MRGFIRGILFGGAVAAVGLGVVSELSPPPQPGIAANIPEAPLKPVVETTADPLLDSAAPDAKPVETVVADAAPLVAPEPDAPRLDAPVPDPVEAGGDEASAADAAPDAAEVAVETAVPEAAVKETAAPPVAESAPAKAIVDKAPQADVQAAATKPTLPGDLTDAPAAMNPAAVQPEAGITASAEAQPAATVPTPPAAPGADNAPAAADLPPPPPLTPAEEAVVAEIAPAEPLTPLEPALDATLPEVVILPDPATSPDLATSPDAAAKLPQISSDLPAAEPEQTAPQPDDDQAPALIQPDAPKAGTAPSTLVPADGLETEVAGVTTNRLPRIGDDPAPAASEPLAITNDTRALAQFARPYGAEAGKPLFSIVLIDTGGPELDREALAKLPFPVSFAIDPTAKDAAVAAAIYRAAGQEVVMLATAIPQGAKAADLEVTFQSHAKAVPEAVAFMELEDAGFQNDRPLASQVVPVIAGQGRGVITWDKGLNAGDQVARRDGVPTAMIFRRLDSEGEAAPVLRRYLDRAAFKAAQDGSVVVVGQTRPETVAALLEWTVEGRASTVSLAPITAAMGVPRAAP